MAEEKQKPLTREDVLRLIEENGGTAKGLDLSEKNLSGIDLSGILLAQSNLSRTDLRKANLQGANLSWANLRESDLEEADLRDAWLFGASFAKANLYKANLQGADLESVNLKKARLTCANLREAICDGVDMEEAQLFQADLEQADLPESYLRGADFSRANLRSADLSCSDLRDAEFEEAKLSRASLALSDFSGAHFEFADWSGGNVIGEEIAGSFKAAATVYRKLGNVYSSLRLRALEGEFFYREMIVRRKTFLGEAVSGRDIEDGTIRIPILQRLRGLWLGIWLAFVEALCGYGERPLRVVTSAAVVVLGLALVYFAIGTLEPATFLNSLYYSAVSFTALGYGQWAPAPEGWVKWLGAFEAFVGVFMIALFLITFVRKMTR